MPVSGRFTKTKNLLVCMLEKPLIFGPQSLNPGISKDLRRLKRSKFCYFAKLIEFVLVLNGMVCGTLFRLDP